MPDNFDTHIEEFRRHKHHLSAWSESIRQFFSQHPELSTGATPVIHSIRSRLKNDEHLREKLNRKRTAGLEFPAEKLLEEITDLAGIRIIHLWQGQFPAIHNSIMEQVNRGDWHLHEEPIAYTWDPEYTSQFDELGIQTKLKPSHYTSIHYVLKPRSGSNLACEVQVRTLFEEAWGEIDHTINYPKPSEVFSCREQLRVLAKLVGACTRLSDSIIRSQHELKQQ